MICYLRTGTEQTTEKNKYSSRKSTAKEKHWRGGETSDMLHAPCCWHETKLLAFLFCLYIEGRKEKKKRKEKREKKRERRAWFSRVGWVEGLDDDDST